MKHVIEVVETIMDTDYQNLNPYVDLKNATNQSFTKKSVIINSDSLDKNLTTG